MLYLVRPERYMGVHRNEQGCLIDFKRKLHPKLLLIKPKSQILTLKTLTSVYGIPNNKTNLLNEGLRS